jgi:hypothetical protein
VAYFLDLSNSKAPIANKDLLEVEKYFKKYILDHKLAFKLFFDFWNYEGNISDTAVA